MLSQCLDSIKLTQLFVHFVWTECCFTWIQKLFSLEALNGYINFNTKACLLEAQEMLEWFCLVWFPWSSWQIQERGIAVAKTSRCFSCLLFPFCKYMLYSEDFIHPYKLDLSAHESSRILCEPRSVLLWLDCIFFFCWDSACSHTFIFLFLSLKYIYCTFHALVTSMDILSQPIVSLLKLSHLPTLFSLSSIAHQWWSSIWSAIPHKKEWNSSQWNEVIAIPAFHSTLC